MKMNPPTIATNAITTRATITGGRKAATWAAGDTRFSTSYSYLIKDITSSEKKGNIQHVCLNTNLTNFNLVNLKDLATDTNVKFPTMTCSPIPYKPISAANYTIFYLILIDLSF
jgi:hypothetical protein